MTGAELADELSTIADAYCADTREAWRMARFVNANMVAILAALRAERPEPAVGDVEAVAIEDDCEPFDPANPKLKPCPFCGAEAELVEIDDMTDADCGGNFVACKACEASTNLRFSAGDDARPLVCEQWNRRAALRPADPGSRVEDAVLDRCVLNAAAKPPPAAGDALTALRAVMGLNSVQTLFEAAEEYPHGPEDVAGELSALKLARAALAAAQEG